MICLIFSEFYLIHVHAEWKTTRSVLFFPGPSVTRQPRISVPQCQTSSYAHAPWSAYKSATGAHVYGRTSPETRASVSKQFKDLCFLGINQSIDHGIRGDLIEFWHCTWYRLAFLCADFFYAVSITCSKLCSVEYTTVFCARRFGYWRNYQPQDGVKMALS